MRPGEDSAVGELRQSEGMTHTGTAVKQLTHQEEQMTLRSLSCPRLGPGNPPGPEQAKEAGGGKLLVPWTPALGTHPTSPILT